MHKDFRFVLKRETHAQHQRVDTVLSKLDVADHDGLLRFLVIHETCFEGMLQVASIGSPVHGYLAEMIKCIRRDLSTLDAPHGHDFPRPHLAAIDPLALDYVVEGSRLGTQVLRKRWAVSTQPQVLAANAYFSVVPVAGRWRKVCGILAGIDPKSKRSVNIIDDTRQLFDVFFDVSQHQDAMFGRRAEPQT